MIAPPNNLPTNLLAVLWISSDYDPPDDIYQVVLHLQWNGRNGWVCVQPMASTRFLYPVSCSREPGSLAFGRPPQAGRPLFRQLPGVEQLLVSAVAQWVPQPYSDGPPMSAPPAGPFLLPPGWYSAYESGLGVALFFKDLFLQQSNPPSASPLYFTPTIGPFASTSTNTARSQPPYPLFPTTADLTTANSFITEYTGGGTGVSYPGYLALGLTIAEFPGYVAPAAAALNASGLVYPGGTFSMGNMDTWTTLDSRLPLPPDYPHCSMLLWPVDRLGTLYDGDAHNPVTGDPVLPYYWIPGTGQMGVIPPEDILFQPDGLGGQAAVGVNCWVEGALPPSAFAPAVLPVSRAPTLPYSIAPDGSGATYLGRVYSERLIGPSFQGNLDTPFCFDDSGPYTLDVFDIGTVTYAGNLYTFHGYSGGYAPRGNTYSVFNAVTMNPAGYTLYLSNVTIGPDFGQIVQSGPNW